MNLRPCPDCARGFVDGRLRHEQTCPLAVGYEEIQDDDRVWFDDRPDATVRRRPIHWAEVAELRAVEEFPPTGQIVGTVTVTQLAPGVRHKSFADVVWFPFGVFGGAA